VSFWSAAFTLFLVLDPVGNLPAWLSILRDVPPQRRQRVVLRECLIALVALLVFLFVGPQVLTLLGVSGPALPIAGGVITFLISLRMMFPRSGGVFGDEQLTGDPFVVPLAIPLLAGPSALATIMLFSTTEQKGPWTTLLLAVLAAWAMSTLILMAGPTIQRWLGERGLVAAERLMGMLLNVIAVHLIMSGVSYGQILGMRKIRRRGILHRR